MNDCVSVLQTEPMHKFSIPIKSEGYDDGEGLACQLVFTYTPKYPEELPIVEINTDESFDELVDKNDLYKHLMEQVKLHYIQINFIIIFHSIV